MVSFDMIISGSYNTHLQTNSANLNDQYLHCAQRNPINEQDITYFFYQESQFWNYHLNVFYSTPSSKLSPFNTFTAIVLFFLDNHKKTSLLVLHLPKIFKLGRNCKIYIFFLSLHFPFSQKIINISCIATDVASYHSERVKQPNPSLRKT